MKHLLFTSILVCGLSFLGCSGDEASIERAKFLLGRGDVSGATEAANILAPLIPTASGAAQFEVLELYSGAELTLAGFDGIAIMAAIIYKTDPDPIVSLEKAITVAPDAANLVKNGYGPLYNFVISSSTFASWPDTHAKNKLYYSLGFNRFAESMRISLEVSGLSSSLAGGSTLDLATCESNFASENSEVTALNTALADAQTYFTSAGLDAQNNLVQFVTTLQANAPPTTNPADIAAFCTYLIAKNAAAQGH